ncbi:MAG: TraR/DksA family transcriptional regulator [Syntrophobacteraceae bacterium]
MEEEAQKLAITEPFDRLDKEGRDEIEQIDLALRKIPLGDYGICENCGEEIFEKRLEVIPWARLCLECAQEFKKKGLRLEAPGEKVFGPPASRDEQTVWPNIPDEYQGLSESEIISLIVDRLESDGRIKTEELELSLKEGVLYLAGVLSSESEHQILMQTITDVLGFSSVIDHLKIDDFMLREGKASEAEKATEGAPITLEDRLFYQEEELSEDLYQSSYQDDDTPYSPPEKPLPDQEGESPP